MKKEAEEGHLANLMIQNAGINHDNLLKDLHNDFTKGNDQYPDTRSQALKFLDRYTKSKGRSHCIRRYCIYPKL